VMNMTMWLRRIQMNPRLLWSGLIVAGALGAAAYLGQRPSPVYILAPIGLAALLILLHRPILGLPVLIVAALLGPLAIGTGTEVSLNLAALLVPALFIVWLLSRMREHHIRFLPSRTTRPLILFLLLAMLSIFIGNVLWDPMVPKSDRLIIVQFAQWGLFAFSAFAFWLAGHLIRQEVWLRRLTATFLIVGGALAIIRMLPGGATLLESVATLALTRASFWALLTAQAAGQLLFNRDLSRPWRIYLIVILVAVLLFAFFDQRDVTSIWMGVAAALGVLLWLRLPKWRWLVVAALVAMTLSGVLFDAIYSFAGGDAEWELSGGSRLALTGRVIEVSMRNPITGIGPAAYRAYGAAQPLVYGRAYYLVPVINSHNNYVDIFSQTGIVGLVLFLWFMIELLRVAWKLHTRYRDGFAGAYVRSMLAIWFSIMVIMALLDWFLPFVYNVGFPGFQASVLIWMFLGGLVMLENLTPEQQNRTPD
jgi:O-antigen ligase